MLEPISQLLPALMPAILAFPFAFALFFALCARIRDEETAIAHIKGLKQLFSYFVWPFQPENMLILSDLDDTVKVSYFFKETKTEKGSLIELEDETRVVTKAPFSESSLNVSAFEARAAQGFASPFALMWRWCVAAAALVMMVYVSLIQILIPAPVAKPAGNGLYYLTTYQVPSFLNTLIITLFVLLMAWLVINIQRGNDRVIRFAAYSVVGINPPNLYAVPSAGFSRVSVLKYLSLLGREINVNISDETAKTLSSVLKSLDEESGSRSLSSILLAKLAMAQKWRQALVYVLKERFDIIQAEAARQAFDIQSSLSETKSKWWLFLLVFVIGLLIGWFISSQFGFGVAPATHNVTVTKP
jgi:hypothetical protein